MSLFFFHILIPPDGQVILTHSQLLKISRPGAYPSIETVAGSCDVNTETHTLDWSIEEIDPADEDARSGLLEFNIAGDDASAFFPIAVDFATVKSYVDVNVIGATLAGEDDSSAPFSVDRLCQAEDYLIA